MVLSALAPPLILIWVLPRNWESAAILAVTVPLIPLFMVLIGMAAEQRTRRRWRTLSTLGARFLDLVSGLETLRAFGRERAAADAIDDAGERYRRETMATLRIGFLSALVLELLATLGTALVAVTVGVQLAAGSLGLEAGLTVLILAPELYAPLRELGAQYHAGADGLAGAERILEVLDLPATVEVREPARAAPDPTAAPVALNGVRFAYAGRGAPVLDGVSLVLAPGEITALVGPSGAGKTTLARIVARLADPQDGTVTCGGVDLRHVDPRAWRARVAWVPQRCTLVRRHASRTTSGWRGQDASAADVARALRAAGRRGARRRAARRRAHARRRRRAAAVRGPVAAHRAGARLPRRRPARRARRAHGAPGPRVGGGDRGRDRAPGRGSHGAAHHPSRRAGRALRPRRGAARRAHRGGGRAARSEVAA